MATTSNELKILVTLVDQTKESSAAILKSLADIKTGVDSLSESKGVEKVAEGLKKTGEEIKKSGEHAEKTEKGIHKLVETMNHLADSVKLVTGGFLAWEAIQMVKEVLDVAARTETLGIVLRVVGNNAGYSAGELQKVDKQVQELGITAEASRQSLTQLIQSGVSLNLAKPLARASQDLAVITGVNSSETFKRLITNIEQLDTLGLRFMGIMIDRESVFARAAAETGKAITETSKKQIFANAVLEEAAKLNGVYLASMNSVGKLLTSFPRFVEEFKDALGSLGQGAYFELVNATKKVIEATTELLKSFKEVEPNVEVFGEGAEGASKHVTGLSAVLRTLGNVISGVIHWLTEHKLVLEVLGETIKNVVIALGLYYTALAGSAVIGVVLTAIGSVVTALTAMEFTMVGVRTTAATMWAAIGGPAALPILLLGLLAVELSKFLNTAKETKPITDQDHAVDEYLKTVDKLNLALGKSEEAQKRLTTARFKDALATGAEKDRTKKELDEAQKAALATDKAVEKILKEREERVVDIDATGKLTDANEKRVTDANKVTDAIGDARVKASNFEKNLREATKSVGEDINLFRTGVSQKLQEELNAVDTMIEALSNKTVDSVNGIQSSLRALERASKEVKTPEEFSKFLVVRERFREEAKKFGVDVTAELDALDEQIRTDLNTKLAMVAAGGEAAFRNKFQSARRMAQLITEIAESDRQRQKQISDANLAQDKFRYDQGLILTREYFNKRIEAVRQDAELERQVNEKKIQALVVEANFEPNDKERIKILTQIAQARDKGYQAQIAALRQIGELEIQEFQRREQLELQANRARVQFNQSIGQSEFAAKQEAAVNLREQLKQYNAVKGSALAIFLEEKNNLELQQKLLQIAFDRKKAQLDLTRAFIDLSDAQSRSAEGDGALTSLETQTALNANIRDRINLLKEELVATEAQRDGLKALGDEPGANRLNQHMVELVTQMHTLRQSIATVGDQWRKTFTDSIADNLTALLGRTKSFKQAFLDIFKDLNNAILKTVTKDLAERFVKVVNETVGDKKSGGLFGKLGELITGQNQSKNELGSKETNPLWVQIANPTKEPEQSVNTTNRQDLQLTLDKLNAAILKLATTAENLNQLILTQQKKSTEPANSLNKGEELIDEKGKPLLPGSSELLKRGDLGSTPDAQAATVMARLMARGFTLEQAAGITANLQRESGFDAHIFGDKGTSFGIAQFRGDRLDNLKEFAGTNNLKEITFDKQLDFISYELKTSEAKAKEMLDKAKTPAEAGIAFSKGFERPYDPTGAEAAARGALAEKIAAQYQTKFGIPKGNAADPVYVKWAEEVMKPGSQLDPALSQKDKIPGTKASDYLKPGEGQRQPDGSFVGTVPQQRYPFDEKPMDGKPIEDALTKAARVAEPHVTSAIVQGVEKAEGPFAGLLTKFLLMAISNASASSGSGGSSSGWIGSLVNFFKGGSSNTGFGTGSQYGNQDYGLNFAEGGLVSGPGTGTSDSIAANLSDGEYVMTAEKTARFLPMLEAMRSGSLDNLFSNLFGSLAIHVPRTPHFASGGLVDTSVMNQPRAVPASPIVINVYTPDANSFRKSKAQIMAELGVATATSVRRNR